VNIEN